jgi:hypothetical protein
MRNYECWKYIAPGHEYKLLSLSRVNVSGLFGNWIWLVGLVACRFYCLEVSLKGSYKK